MDKKQEHGKQKESAKPAADTSAKTANAKIPADGAAGTPGRGAAVPPATKSANGLGKLEQAVKNSQHP